MGDILSGIEKELNTFLQELQKNRAFYKPLNKKPKRLARVQNIMQRVDRLPYCYCARTLAPFRVLNTPGCCAKFSLIRLTSSWHLSTRKMRGPYWLLKWRADESNKKSGTYVPLFSGKSS